jgi:hypothetical protein
MTDSVASDFAPALAASKQTTVAVAVSSSSSAWGTGDYKVSAKSADHADPTGGSWLLCDSSAIDSAFTDLIALVGGSRPDARGRMLVMQGTNADVSTLLANDGQAVANRRPKHRTSNGLTASTSISPNPHAHTATVRQGTGSTGAMNFSFNDPSTVGSLSVDATSLSAATTMGGSVGTNNGNDALDTPSFIVPGNLFIHT